VNLQLAVGRAPRRAVAAGPDPDEPSARGFIALLEAFRATGGTAPSDIVGRLLAERQGWGPDDLDLMVCTHQVFAFPWRASLWLPMFQFDEQALAPKPGPQRVRAALPARWSGWRLAGWFARPNARLSGRSPADAIEADPVAVLAAARAQSRPDHSPTDHPLKEVTT
jgi:hypothetical protein